MAYHPLSTSATASSMHSQMEAVSSICDLKMHHAVMTLHVHDDDDNNLQL
jgi:hypothetical protein